MSCNWDVEGGGAVAESRKGTDADCKAGSRKEKNAASGTGVPAEGVGTGVVAGEGTTCMNDRRGSRRGFGVSEEGVFEDIFETGKGKDGEGDQVQMKLKLRSRVTIEVQSH